jgi:hypothetical protein
VYGSAKCDTDLVYGSAKPNTDLVYGSAKLIIGVGHCASLASFSVSTIGKNGHINEFLQMNVS